MNKHRVLMRSTCLAVCTLSGLSACTESGSDAAAAPVGAVGEAVQADSAGIPVVVNPAEPPGGAVWEIAATHRLEIGEADGAPEELLFDVDGGHVLSDGRIVLANSGTFEVRFYDADGRYLRSTGREGDGPGEFRRLELAGPIAGDSLIAFDSRLLRITVVAPDGTVARSYPLPPDPVGFPILVGALADGRTVMAIRGRSTDTIAVIREPATIGIVSEDGSEWTLVGVFPGSEASVVRTPGASVSVGVLNGRDVRHFAAGDRIVLATDDEFSLRVHGADGGLLRLIRQERPPRAADLAEVERLLDQVRARASERPGPVGEQTLIAVDQMPRHETLPAFGLLRLDRTGHLWVREYAQPGTYAVDWQVFDPDGVLVAHVRLPEGLEILDIGEDYLLALESDDLGVERVRMYELTRGGG